MPRIWPVVLLLTLFAPCAAAQHAATPSPLKPDTALNGPPSGTRTITLGNSTVPLDGLWKFHIGDNMAWAQPDYDDSAWGTMDLTPAPGSYSPYYGSSGYVPGWTARGYKGYSGYAWYRLRVNIEGSPRALALKMPDNFDDAYQVYVNGQLVGQFGRFTAHGVTAYFNLPRVFALPSVASRPSDKNLSLGTLTAETRNSPTIVAIRMWMASGTALNQPDVGGLHGPPVLGRAAPIAGLLQLDWDGIDHARDSELLEMAALLLALLVAFALFSLDRTEPAYLWLGLVCAATLASVSLVIVETYATVPANLNPLLDVMFALRAGLWVLFWAYWFRLSGMARIHRIVWSLVVLLSIGIVMLDIPLYGTLVPVHAIVWLSPLTNILQLLLGIALVWVTVRGIRKNKLEGWLALPAVVLMAISQYSQQLLLLHISLAYFLFGTRISLSLIATILSLLIITVLLLRRFLHGQRQREQWKLEIEQARNIQQVLIPSAEALPAFAGFAIESEYRPAQRVGGDFFQVIRHPSDGSLLIVLGDVTGHGLKAAMMVSLLVGAIRREADTGNDPMAMLENLNRRLLGRGNIYATCLALRIQPDGQVTLANAGHLPPYRNGKELEVEGSMPLGMAPDAEFTQMNFHLEPNDRLLLMTDGVAEARDKDGTLFGFERVATLVRNPIAAAEVASAAQAFGQQDDITVIRIARDAVAAPAPAV